MIFQSVNPRVNSRKTNRLADRKQLDRNKQGPFVLNFWQLEVWDIMMAAMQARSVHTMGDEPKALFFAGDPNGSESWAEMVKSLNPRQVRSLEPTR
eukprot:1175410-Prorocentrum_minimum.AAC.4